jgi:hypothetical protein
MTSYGKRDNRSGGTKKHATKFTLEEEVVKKVG